MSAVPAEAAPPASPGEPGLVQLEPAAPVAPDPALLEALNAWRLRLASAGIACRGVALQGFDPSHCVDFPDTQPALAARWQALREQVHPAAPLQVSRPDTPGGELLVGSALQMPDGRPGAVGVALAPPHNERTVQLVLLALGWLQLALSALNLARSQRALLLLDLLGHAASQRNARAAAQEWINRTAAWARAETGEPPARFDLMLFWLRGDRPHWWVSADAAWAEKASPAVQSGVEAATQAAVQQQELRQEGAWAVPVMDEEGRAVAVLVALTPAGGLLPEGAAAVMRVSLGLAEPLLRQWRLAERALWRHALAAAGQGWTRLRGPGHLAWKFGGAGTVLALAVLLGWPVADRVTANTVIEGRQRVVMTVPFDGFIAQVLVRPGQRVDKGQPLARLEDRDLKLEQQRYRSEREQAAGRLRQAMTEHEAAAFAQAQAEVQQSEAQLALVEAKLARAELLAPVAGLVVTGDWVQQIGAPVETGKELFEIASGEGYRVVLHVPDRDIARVRVGQEGALRLAAQPHATHAFSVSTVTATASVQDSVNGFRVEAQWIGEAPPLSPGMQGVGKIEVGRTNLLTLWTRSSVDWLRLKLWSWWW